MAGFPQFHPKTSGTPLDALPRESELLLLRLRESGLRVSLQHPRFDLGLDEKELHEVTAWLAAQTQNDGERRWIAVGPGSKMPAKQWPLENYDAVVRDLIGAFDIWPVVFGGPEDREIGDGLIERWGRGYNAAGALDVRAAGVALKRCQLYLGNDTGTMHLAALLGVPVVAIFGSTEPRLTGPLGNGHIILRHHVECSPCFLRECPIDFRCMKAISVQEVADAVLSMLRKDSEEFEI